MIGNDIVDLALAQKESNWKRKGFLDKIFTKKEQGMIFNAEDPAIMVWNLWTMKEAAYKIYNRQTLIRAYIPLQLECFDLKAFDVISFGKVLIKNLVYFTKTETTVHFIHTIAVENPLYFNTVKSIENSKNIQKFNGIPSCFEKQSSVPRPISISRHGRYERIVSF